MESVHFPPLSKRRAGLLMGGAAKDTGEAAILDAVLRELKERESDAQRR